MRTTKYLFTMLILLCSGAISAHAEGNSTRLNGAWGEVQKNDDGSYSPLTSFMNYSCKDDPVNGWVKFTVEGTSLSISIYSLAGDSGLFHKRDTGTTDLVQEFPDGRIAVQPPLWKERFIILKLIEDEIMTVDIVENNAAITTILLQRCST